MWLCVTKKEIYCAIFVIFRSTNFASKIGEASEIWECVWCEWIKSSYNVSECSNVEPSKWFIKQNIYEWNETKVTDIIYWNKIISFLFFLFFSWIKIIIGHHNKIVVAFSTEPVLKMSWRKKSVRRNHHSVFHVAYYIYLPAIKQFLYVHGYCEIYLNLIDFWIQTHCKPEKKNKKDIIQIHIHAKIRDWKRFKWKKG